MLWKVFLEQEPNDFQALHWYLAQIAREVVVSRNPPKLRHLKAKDFILKFKYEKKEASAESGAQVKETKLQNSKAFWGAVASSPQKVLPDGRPRT